MPRRSDPSFAILYAPRGGLLEPDTPLAWSIRQELYSQESWNTPLAGELEESEGKVKIAASERGKLG